jgi:lipoate-protein ligase B
MTPSLTPCLSIDLGRAEYEPTWRLQEHLQSLQIAGSLGPVLLTVEHPPTITVGRRGTTDEVVAPEAVLRQRGVSVIETNRGGQVTYHGPGQLVLYPLVNVEALGLHEYLRLLEESVIRTIAQWGIDGYRVEGRTGVWVGKEKIAALGIRVRRWWAIHGLALNVTTDLNHFGLIIPCGIRDRGVCSLQKLLGPATPSRTEVRDALLGNLARLLHLELRQGSPEELPAPP